MIPVFDSFDYFGRLLPLLIVLVPLAAVVRRGRSVLFAGSGLLLLALVAPRLALIHLVFWLVVAAMQPIVAATGERRGGVAILFASLGVTLAPLIVWKLFPIPTVANANDWFGAPFLAISDTLGSFDRTFDVVGLIGVSFATFRAADLLIASNLGLLERQRPGAVLATGLFPPLLVVGPIATWGETKTTIARPVPLDATRFVNGASQILVGLLKVFVFAYALSWSVEIFTFTEVNGPERLWVGLAAYTLFFYVNFAGYSDIAIGIGTLLGADLRPNFDRPYLQTTPAAFWNSWHISLTQFLRRNVFTPLVAGRPERMHAATMLTMVLIGLWHSIGWAELVFGIYHGAFLIGHRLLERRRPAGTGTALRIAKMGGVFLWYALSLPLLQLDLGEAVDFYGALIGVTP